MLNPRLKPNLEHTIRDSDKASNQNVFEYVPSCDLPLAV